MHRAAIAAGLSTGIPVAKFGSIALAPRSCLNPQKPAYFHLFSLSLSVSKDASVRLVCDDSRFGSESWVRVTEAVTFWCGVRRCIAWGTRSSKNPVPFFPAFLLLLDNEKKEQ